jgi:CheY-like chemotaxis protein
VLASNNLLIYLIEDNKVDSLIEHSVIQRTLPEATVCLFYNAQSALDSLESTLSESGKEGLPHLIFLDIAMPGMDGFAFLEQCTIRKLYSRPTHPLTYILTTTLSAVYLQKAKNHHLVEDVLFKPFSQKAFAALLDKHFPQLAYTKPIEPVKEWMEIKELTIENWVNEYKRIERKYAAMEDKQSLEARGLLDHLEAVWLIIHDYNSRNK